MPRAPKETEAQKEARELQETEAKNARVAELHKRHDVLKAQVEEIKAEQDRIKAEIAELLGNELGTHAHNTGSVQLQRNARFDQDTAREVIGNISADLLESVTIKTIDAKKCKEILPPATYKLCMKDGAHPKVVFK